MTEDFKRFLVGPNTLFAQWSWKPPSDWVRLTTIDTHTGGEPLRIVTSGLPEIKGRTVIEKRRYFMENFDPLRRGLLREPRGHADMYGAILTPPSDDADLDVFFINTEGYSPMCGHAILAITKVVLETGIIRKTGERPELIINVPPGRNFARAIVEDGEVRHASFQNVPSFVYLRDKRVDVPGLGSVTFDIAFGGAFYAIVDAGPLKVGLRAEYYNTLIDYGRRIKRAVLAHFPIEHPFEPDMSSLFGVIFTGEAATKGNHSRNVTIFEDGEVDRSATGTGVSARAALLCAQEKLPLGQRITIESILSSTMTVEAVKNVKFGPYDAVIPEVGGSAHIMGQSELYFDPRDPFNAGFIFR
jgi:proline racemase